MKTYLEIHSERFKKNDLNIAPGNIKVISIIINFITS